MRYTKHQIILFVGIFLASFTTSYSQSVTYTKEKLLPIAKSATVNFNEIEDPYLVSIANLEAPSVSGNSKKKHITALKEEIAQRYPRSEKAITKIRDDALPPTIEIGFLGNSTSPGIPLDNTLATNGEQVLSAINFHVAVKDTDGGVLKNFSLNQFAAQAGIQGTSFDPRLIYDLESDRFILVMLNGFSSDDTHVIIAFSETADATENWNVYRLEGNVNDNTTWTDFPMISVTATDLIITGNLLRDGETWQEGFDETIMWQIDKEKGYTGEDITPTIFKDIEYEGFRIRNLCPAESADGTLESNCYFLSNRNFSMESDSFFLVELTGGVDDTDTELIVNLVQTDQPYGAPPNAEMRTNVLQTNDARVLEVFRLGDELQFVGNTRNLDNNKAGIYHGHIRDISSDPIGTLTHIIGDTFEIGYPGISYTGVESGDSDAIISFNHSSVERDPGVSAMYYHPEDGYSDMIEVWKGSGYVAMLNGSVQRWGDYAGSQRDFSNLGSCWISGFYGSPSLLNFPWVAKLNRPTEFVDVVNVNEFSSSMNVFPNPVSNRFVLEFDIPQKSKNIAVSLINNNGQIVSDLLNTVITKSGLTQFSFDKSNMNAGMYYIRVNIDNQTIVSKQLIIK